MRFLYLVLALLLALNPIVGAAQDKRCKVVEQDVSFFELTFYTKDDLLSEYCASIRDGVLFLNLAGSYGSLENEGVTEQRKDDLVDGVACFRFAETARLLLEKDHDFTSRDIRNHCRPLWSQICDPNASIEEESCLAPDPVGIEVLSSLSRTLPIQLPGYGADYPPIPACWAQYTNLQLKLRTLFEEGDGWDAKVVDTGKEQLRGMLEAEPSTCPDYAEFYSVPAGRLLKHSLIDIAVLADSSDYILAHRDLVFDGLNKGEDELEYSGDIVHWAAYFESHNSVKALAEIGVDLAANDERGVSPLHLANARTAAGLRNIVFLARNGVDLDAKVEGVYTPLLVSYLMYDFDKAMCLRKLGAQEPSIEEYLSLASRSEKGVYFADGEFEIQDRDLMLGRREIESICGK